jgi:hypothetical protein
VAYRTNERSTCCALLPALSLRTMQLGRTNIARRPAEPTLGVPSPCTETAVANPRPRIVFPAADRGTPALSIWLLPRALKRRNVWLLLELEKGCLKTRERTVQIRCWLVQHSGCNAATMARYDDASRTAGR